MSLELQYIVSQHCVTNSENHWFGMKGTFVYCRPCVANDSPIQRNDQNEVLVLRKFNEKQTSRFHQTFL